MKGMCDLSLGEMAQVNGGQAPFVCQGGPFDTPGGYNEAQCISAWNALQGSIQQGEGNLSAAQGANASAAADLDSAISTLTLVLILAALSGSKG
jgi:hypothetical protein